MRKPLVSLLTFIILLRLEGMAQDKKMEKHFLRDLEKVKELLQYNEYHQAIQILDVYSEVYSNHPSLNFYLGYCYLRSGSPRRALPYLEKAIKIPYKTGLDTLELLRCYAEALLENERPKEAKPYFERYMRSLDAMLAQDPGNPDIQKAYHVKKKEAALFLHYCDNAVKAMENPIPVKIKHLDSRINSRYPDFGPVVTADGSELFFTSRRPGNQGGLASDGFPYEDIYVARKDSSGEWLPAENIGPPVNTQYHDATISISPDGRTLFLYKYKNGGDIYYSQYKDGKWTIPQPMPKGINSPYWEPSITISADGRTIYFVSNRPENGSVAKDRDIFVAYRLPDGRWSEPVRLGPPINTPYDEDAPFLHPDGKTLYFSSNRPESIGGFDIFYSQLQENGKWSEPVNLGYPVNTPGDDIYFTLTADGLYGYYASERSDGFGEKDIYLIDFTPEEVVQVAEIKVDTLQQEAIIEKSQPVVIPKPKVTLLKGNVFDEKTKQPLKAEIVIIDLITRDTFTVTESDPNTGRYLVTLVPGKNYAIFAKAPYHLMFSKNLNVPAEQEEYQEIIQHIPLPPLEVGKTFALRNIFFDFDKATLRPESIVELENACKFLKENPNLRIEIGGHTDIRGSDEYNMDLSLRRAKAVYDYLVKNCGIDASRLTYKGYGETQLLTRETTEEAHQLNRRVEFKIIGN